MKKVHSILIFASFLPFLVQSQIPNNGFENWTNMGNYNNPNDWSSLNDLTAPANVYTCTKGSPGNPGTSYLKLTSKQVSGMGIKPGIAVSGLLNSETMEVSGGFSFEGRPEALLGKWQYMAFGSDQGFISILLTLWNETTQSRDTISYTYHPLVDMAMSWANFSIPLSYQSTSFPDSAIIVLSASNANGAATSNNSYLYIDNLSFSNTIYLATADIAKPTLRIFPNPVTSQINIENPAINKACLIEVIDMNGKLIIQRNVPASIGTITLDVSNLSSGAYLLKMRNGFEVYVSNFMKQ